MNTQKDKILAVLSDGQWHPSTELNKPSVAGWHASQRITDMNKSESTFKIVSEAAHRVFENWSGNKMICAYKIVKIKSVRK